MIHFARIDQIPALAPAEIDAILASKGSMKPGGKAPWYRSPPPFYAETPPINSRLPIIHALPANFVPAPHIGRPFLRCALAASAKQQPPSGAWCARRPAEITQAPLASAAWWSSGLIVHSGKRRRRVSVRDFNAAVALRAAMPSAVLGNCKSPSWLSSCAASAKRSEGSDRRCSAFRRLTSPI
jgi:hypothetical protein